MSTFFTQAELDIMSKGKCPPGYEHIPPEHYASYLALAGEQIAMVQVTMATMLLQAMRPANSTVDQAKAGSCVAGLERAILSLLGFRKGSAPLLEGEKP